MSRIVGLLLIILLVLLLIPQVRERVSPYAQPLLDPFYEWSARNRVTTLVKLVQEQESLGSPIPDPSEFTTYVERRDMQRDAGTDPWGNPYYLRVDRREYYVGSAGKDGVEETPDDIVSARLPVRRPPVRR